jgi:hypothetical protein
MFSKSVIGNSMNIIDDSRVMLQLVASFMIIIYDRHIFIVQATEYVLTWICLNSMSQLGSCKKFNFTFKFEVQMWVQILPKIWEGLNTYSSFIKQVESEHR